MTHHRLGFAGPGLAILLAALALGGLATAVAAQTPRAGGQLVHGSVQEPDRIWGPVTGLTVSSEISQLVNASLIEINDRLEYQPLLATQVPTLENGGISKDGLRYTFTLRKGVKWHDGQPFTSADVAFTHTVLLNPDVDVRGRVGWNKISRVEAPDDHTVVFQFAAVDAPFLDRVAALGILPKHILGTLSGAEIKTHKWFRAPVGTGPFVFKEWVPGSHLVLAKNPGYWKPGRPYLDRIIYKIVPDANALLNQLETGEVDTRLRLVNEHIDVVKKLPNVTLVSTPSIVPWLIWVNNTVPPFNDKKVRQALAHGFDKARLAGTILGGHVTPAWQLLPPVSWAYSPTVVRHAYDPAKARALLDEAGWKLGGDGVRVRDGKRLSVEIANIAGEQERVQVLSFVQQQWKQIGVEARIRAVDVGSMWGAMLPKRQYEMAYSYSGRLPDPDMSTHYLSPELKPSTNFAGYSNAEVDRLLLAANATVDRAKRKAGYQKAQEIVADDVVYLFLYWLNNNTVLNKRVQGYKPAPGYTEFWNADEWWVTK
ncbi:MAG: peptide ABC transporter substrate-binding protein [Candidatus Rokubacteria bacterium]|nr:peptide ABC transporter substrate-binding protein [Candidatus Rokubacteria bacterium]